MTVNNITVRVTTAAISGCGSKLGYSAIDYVSAFVSVTPYGLYGIGFHIIILQAKRVDQQTATKASIQRAIITIILSNIL